MIFADYPFATIFVFTVFAVVTLLLSQEDH